MMSNAYADHRSHTMHLMQDVGQLIPLPDVLFFLNYGVDRLRFLRPVPVGSRLRACVRLTGVDLLPEIKAARGWPAKLRMAVEAEVEGEETLGPAMVVELLGHPVFPEK